MTDQQIARTITLKPIQQIASQLNISEDDLQLYGKYKAKLPLNLIDMINTFLAFWLNYRNFGLGKIGLLRQNRIYRNAIRIFERV